MTLRFSDLSGSGHLFVGGTNFRRLHADVAGALLDQEPFNAGKWQAVDVSDSQAHDTYELLNTTLWLDIPENQHELENMIEPDMPWSEGHFQERVAGLPVNPGDWHHRWPYHGNSEALHQRDDQKRYDHNYMERFWPKLAGTDGTNGEANRKGWRFDYSTGQRMGYRFAVGDLQDVVDLLKREPLTRQAFLPVWFPEDTGATAGQRVPCTLGYHFIIREGKLHVVYYLRSCEIYRHFKNDVYMAMRLGQWVRDRVVGRQLNQLLPEDCFGMGTLTMHITSLHGFVGDTRHIEDIEDSASDT